MPIDDQLAAAIATAAGIRLDSSASVSVGGGSINAGFRVTDTAGNSYFLKVNVSQGRDMFEAEREGLLALGQPDTLKVPRPIACGSTSCHAFLLLEWLDLSGSGRDALDLLGHGLAGLHRVTNTSFGWHRDNTIGSTPQKNQHDDNWVRFYRECRLRYQLELAAANGFTGNLQRQGEKLLDGLEQFFSTHKPCKTL